MTDFYRPLGASGVKVSALCLGTMMFGGPTSEADAAGIVDAARDAGINFIDTADVYNEGRSEEITGRAIARDRDRWVLATKLWGPMGPGPNDGGLSRRWVFRAVEGSLRRLGTDHVDIQYLHRDMREIPIAETLGALRDLIAQGKIRYYGVSNWQSWRVAELCALADKWGMDRPVVSQPYYNAMNRAPEAEHIPACRHFGLGVVPYSPLARGVLTAKYDPDAAPPADSRAGRADQRMMQTEWRPESLRLARAIDAHAVAKGFGARHFALAWVLGNRAVSAVIGGPRTLDQWRDYLRALDYPYDTADESFLDGLVAVGHPSTPGYNDPAYPLIGRFAKV
jgi:aryl-alcohol dehydrogenase (NADP+)